MNKILIQISLSILSLPAWASMPACLIAKEPLPENIQMTVPEIQSYQKKLMVECELSQRAYRLSYMLEAKGISLEHINHYQGLRYVDAGFYNQSHTLNISVPYIYQSDDNDKKGPRQRVVWDNWSEGIKQLEGERERVLQGQAFTKLDLERVHKGFYKFSNEVGAYAHDPMVGVFKSASDNDNFWMVLKTPQEIENTKRNFAAINGLYKKLGLIDSTKDPSIYDILRVKPALDANNQPVQAVYGGDSRANMEHLDRILAFMNSTLRQGIGRQHIVFHGRLFTPGEAAFLTQQFYVQVHPFSEGNGRTSRFIQELMLTTMGLPPGASGELMDIDVYTPFNQYYAVAMDRTTQQIGVVEECLESYKQYHIKSENQIRSQQQLLDYNCRLIE